MYQAVALSALSAQSALLCLGAKMQKVRKMQGLKDKKSYLCLAIAPFEGMSPFKNGRKIRVFAIFFCVYQKSCIFASLELAEPLNNA